MAASARAGGAGAAPPRVDAAWGIVAYGFLLTLLSTGLRFSVGPFMVPLMEDFVFSPTELSVVVAMAMLLFGIAMPFVGRLADVWSSRRVLASGLVLLAASLAVAATTRSPSVFILAYAFFASIGFAATSQVPLSPVVSRWFVRRRGFAMMCLTSGGMAGIAVMTPLTAILIQWVGWRATFLLMAATAFIAFLPATWWALRHEPGMQAPRAAAAPPPDRKDAPDPGKSEAPGFPWWKAFGTTPFWFLAIGFFGCGFSMSLLGAHGVPMLEDHGFETMTASFGIALIGLVSIFGSIALGAASDRVGRPLFLALIYFVRSLGFLGMVTVGQDWQLFSVAAVGGLAWAGSTALTSAITADLFGPASVGTLFGILYVSHQVGGAFGSYLGGWGIEVLGSYRFPFALAAGLLMLGALLSFRLRPYQRVLGSGAPALQGQPPQGQPSTAPRG